MTRFLLLFVVLFGFFNAGCSTLHSIGLVGARVRTVKTVAEPPSDVTVFLSVEDEGEPVAHLASENFQIYENDLLLDNDAIGLELLPRDDMATGFTVLLLDISESPSESELMRIARGAASFVEKVTTTQPVTVIAFDGSERAREVARFDRVEEAVKRPLPDLSKFLSPDTSRDLNNAFIAAVQGVTKNLESSKKEGKFGTVATLVRGPDLAGRKTDNDIRNAVTVSGFDFYSVSPKGVQISSLPAIGQDEQFKYDTIDTLPMKMTDLGMRVRNAWYSNYLISYCSPARSGERKLKIKVVFESEKGGIHKGSARSQFDSSGFSGGCASNKSKAPASSASQAAAEEPPPEADEPEDEQEETEENPKPVTQKSRPKKNTPPPPGPMPSESEQDEEPEVVAPPSSGKYE